MNLHLKFYFYFQSFFQNTFLFIFYIYLVDYGVMLRFAWK